MKIRSDFESASTYLERLILFGNVFRENNLKHWPHFKNQEDFKNIFDMEDEVRYKFENLYSVGRDLAVDMSRHLGAFNDPAVFPTITSYINSFDDGWLSETEKLRKVSTEAKEEAEKRENYSWAVQQMIILFDKQVELLQDVKNTLNIIKTTDIYKIESAGHVIEKPITKVQGDYYSVQNISTDGNSQVFIGKFNKVEATLNNTGHTELATAFQQLRATILASSELSEDKKKENIEILNQIGEEVAKEKPNKTLIKVLGEGLLSVLKTIPDIAKILELVIQLLPR